VTASLRALGVTITLVMAVCATPTADAARLQLSVPANGGEVSHIDAEAVAEAPAQVTVTVTPTVMVSAGPDGQVVPWTTIIPSPAGQPPAAPPATRHGGSTLTWLFLGLIVLLLSGVTTWVWTGSRAAPLRSQRGGRTSGAFRPNTPDAADPSSVGTVAQGLEAATEPPDPEPPHRRLRG
jgi:hypothetical protein